MRTKTLSAILTLAFLAYAVAGYALIAPHHYAL